MRLQPCRQFARRLRVVPDIQHYLHTIALQPLQPARQPRIGDAALALGATLDTLEVNPLLADGARIEALDALATYNH